MAQHWAVMPLSMLSNALALKVLKLTTSSWVAPIQRVLQVRILRVKWHLRAGLPITTSGMTVNRFCSSGLQTIALAAQRIIAGEGDIYVAGGVESISCVQQEMNTHMLADSWLVKNKPEIYWNMLQTAEQVAKRYGISREAMDEYGAASQQKAVAALAAGLFEAEIAPITVTMGVADPVMGLTTKQVTVSKDEGIRDGTTKEGIAGLRSALPGGLISAGNASQFSDGGGACVHHERDFG